MNAVTSSLALNRNVARLAGAGILAVFGCVMLQHGVAQSIGGSSLYGIRDAEKVMAFFGHPQLRTIYWLCTAMLMPMVLFAVGFRTWANGLRRTLAADLFAAFVLIEVPVLLATCGLQIAMVDFAAAGRADTVLALFAVLDGIYNDGLECTEVGWTASFAIAAWRSGAVPRWVAAGAGVVSGGLAFNVVARWLVLPEAALMPTYGVFALWMLATGVSLLITRGPAPTLVPQGSRGAAET